MPRLDLNPAAMARELLDFGQRAAGGVRTLRQLGALRPGVTPRQAVWRRDQVTLYRYTTAHTAPGQPLLIVYALVNRPDMADLEDGRSLIQGLVQRGFDVYLLDWGYPGPLDRELGLDDYINGYLDGAVDHLRSSLARAALPLLGICQGGTFSLCYAALQPRKVESLVTTVTPVDFHTGGDTLAHLVRHVDVDALIAGRAVVSGDCLNALFLSLKPYQLLQQKYLRMLEHFDDPRATAMFLRMEQWIFDSPNLTARACREFACDLYQANRLARGELEIGGQPVRLDAIRVPVLNIYARADHLVPPASSRALRELIGSADYTEHELAGGHIGVYVTAGAPVAAVVAEWMQTRSAG
ncbi:MAG: class III poly(R)-hydroxyalkanoic acid synthase subunit PhaC [Gammaproteobacteria bacterium]